MTREELIEKLISYQHANNLTQIELAEELGLPLGTVQNWCLGRRLPNFDNATKIMKLLEEKQND